MIHTVIYEELDYRVREHASLDDAVDFINSTFSYVRDASFVIYSDASPIKFGVFTKPIVLEDGDMIYEPVWISDKADLFARITKVTSR